VTGRVKSALYARAARLDAPWVWALVAAAVGLVARAQGTARWEVRLGYVQQRRGRLDLARAAYERAAAHPECLLAWRLRLIDLYEAQGELRRADQLIAELASRAPEQHAGAEVWEQLGAVRHRTGDRPGADTAYRAALARAEPGTSVSSGARLRLARLLDEVGHWAQARELLDEEIAEQPDHAEAWRLLATVAHHQWQWGGSFEGALAAPDEAVLRPLGSAGADPVTARARAHVVACGALEEAVRLAPDQHPWWSSLGDLRREAGYRAGAIEAEQRGLDGALAQDRPSAFRLRHPREFKLERAYHEAGLPRVEDPLFDVGFEVVEDGTAATGAARSERPVGLFTARATFYAVRVEGFALSRDVDVVEVLLDDVVLRQVNVGGEGFFPEVVLVLRRATVDLLPPDAELRLRTERGPLLAEGRGEALRVRVPHGSGELPGILQRGGSLDKKGHVRPAESEAHAHQDAYVALYAKVRDFFDEHVGTPLFALYGTLLGAYRDGDLIPGDDDFDATYVSEHDDPVAVKHEATELMVALVQAGFTVLFNRRGRLFRVAHDAIGGPDVHVDVAPMWFMDGRAWVHPQLALPATREDFLPVRDLTVRGTTVHVPQRPEVFLEGNYGSGWQHPDPGFVYYRSAVDRQTHRTLNRALLRPSEYRALQERLAGPDARPGMGRLVAIGFHPLYPLNEVALS